MSEEEFANLIAEASREISRQVATDILIIEDEPLIAMDIEEMVESLGHRVVGTARTHAEATRLFAQKHPKMVLADIQLADGSSGLPQIVDNLRAVSPSRMLHPPIALVIAQLRTSSNEAPKRLFPSDQRQQRGHVGSVLLAR